jgi:hypothetical protein
MKICDRCYQVDGSSVKATEILEFHNTSEEFDLCKSCADMLNDVITLGYKIDGRESFSAVNSTIPRKVEDAIP